MNKTKFNFRIEFKTEDICLTIHDSVIQETQDKEIRRGTMNINPEGKYLNVLIDADDIVAARSFFNSLMRVVKTSFDIVKIIESNE